MLKNLSINFNSIHDSVIGHNGIQYGLMKQYKKDLTSVFEKAKSMYSEDKTNFLNIFEKDTQVDKILETTENLKKKFKNMVIVGIGGSSLGTESIYTAFNQRYDHEFFPEKRKLYFLDNYDARLVEYLIENIDLEKTVFVVISKSGGTLETMSQFFYIKDHILKNYDKDFLRERLIFITDKEKGQLNIINEDLNVTKFYIPENVGGRFSIFTPVGLVASAFVDIDIKEIISGVENSTKTFLETDIEENPFLKYALLQAIYDKDKDFHATALLFYNDRFIKFAEWFRQLWGESLGKPCKDGKLFFGTIPLAFRGSTDQHSQLQQFISGKNDKIYTVINYKEESEYKFKKPELEKFNYIENYSFNDLLFAAKTGTVRSLIEQKRPVIEFNIENFGPFEFGQFFQFFMIITALTGFIFEINPFDQPGVEQGKVYTVEALKRGL